MAGNSRTPSVSVTSRVFDLLGAFDARHPRLTLSELARRSGLPLATAHRLLIELVSWGAVTRQPSGVYVIGRRLWRLGLLAPLETGLREIASPFLHDLYVATLATVHLAVRDRTKVLYLARLAGHSSVPVVSDIGVRLPLHTTGVGKVLLAYAPACVQAEVLGHLTPQTPYSVVQLGILRRQLARVLREGYATTAEEMALGACSLAVPIRKGEDVVAALGIVVPTLRERVRLVAAMRVAAQGISQALQDVQLDETHV